MSKFFRTMIQRRSDAFPHRACMELVVQGDYYSVCTDCGDAMEALRQQDAQGSGERADAYMRGFATIWLAQNPKRGVMSLDPMSSPVVIRDSSPLLVSGNYRTARVTLMQATKLVHDSVQGIESAISQVATANVLTELLGINVPVGQVDDVLGSGQIALIFELNQHVSRDTALSLEDVKTVGYRLTVLVRTL